MQHIMSSLKRFLIAEDGPTSVEYAVMLAMIIMVCITAIQAVGNNTSGKFQEAADLLT